MDIEQELQAKLIENSQNFLSGIISASDFDTDNPQQFKPYKMSYKLNDNRYDIYSFNSLAGYKPNRETDNLLFYTFFIAKPDENLKKEFMDEAKKQFEGLEFNAEIIGEYYHPFFPEFIEFKELYNSMAETLETEMFKGKGYKFGFHLVTVTTEFDFIMVFLELNSYNKVLDTYYKNGVFDPTV